MAVVISGICQACDDKEDNVILLNSGEIFCPDCLVLRISDGSIVVARPDGIVTCNSCAGPINVTKEAAYCEDCRNSGYDSGYDDGFSEGQSEGTSYCWNCDNTAAYCEPCAEEMVQSLECSDCGTVKTLEELIPRCVSCETELHTECLGLSAPIVTEGGDAVFTDMEISWG